MSFISNKIYFLICFIGKNGISFNSHYLLSIFLCRFSNVSFNLLSFYSSSGKPKDRFRYLSNPKFVWDSSPKLAPIWPKSINSLKSCPLMNNYLFIFLIYKNFTLFLWSMSLNYSMAVSFSSYLNFLLFPFSMTRFNWDFFYNSIIQACCFLTVFFFT